MTVQIKIEAQVNAPVQKVWEYMNSPQHITQWNFAAPDWHCPKAENDLKVGGKLKSRMEAKDGSFGFDFEAIYSEVVENEKISYSLGDGRKVTTLFEGSNGSTIVTTEFDAEEENSPEMQKQGWQAILNNFKNYVEKN